CDVCYEKTSAKNGKTLTCGHFYCFHCLESLCRAALHDSALLPLKCCGAVMDSNLPRLVLSGADLVKIESLQDEYEKASFKVMHCPNRHCAVALDLDVFLAAGVQSSFSCPECGSDLCASCRGRWHPGRACAATRRRGPYAADPPLLSLARTRGWQRCPACGHLTERTAGCNHMTCLKPCLQQFCYACGQQWKSCECPTFGEATSAVGGQ
ncbi:unnamed protein product, partial [Heterosigma akashiwo]